MVIFDTKKKYIKTGNDFSICYKLLWNEVIYQHQKKTVCNLLLRQKLFSIGIQILQYSLYQFRNN